MGTKWKWRKGEGSGTQHPLFGFDGVEEIEGNKEIHFLTLHCTTKDYEGKKVSGSKP